MPALRARSLCSSFALLRPGAGRPERLQAMDHGRDGFVARESPGLTSSPTDNFVRFDGEADESVAPLPTGQCRPRAARKSSLPVVTQPAGQNCWIRLAMATNLSPPFR